MAHNYIPDSGPRHLPGGKWPPRQINLKTLVQSGWQHKVGGLLGKMRRTDVEQTTRNACYCPTVLFVCSSLGVGRWRRLAWRPSLRFPNSLITVYHFTITKNRISNKFQMNIKIQLFFFFKQCYQFEKWADWMIASYFFLAFPLSLQVGWEVTCPFEVSDTITPGYNQAWEFWFFKLNYWYKKHPPSSGGKRLMFFKWKCYSGNLAEVQGYRAQRLIPLKWKNRKRKKKEEHNRQHFPNDRLLQGSRGIQGNKEPQVIHKSR